MSTVTFIGAGSFGTALSTIVAAKGCRVNIFDIDKAHLSRMEEAMENVDYLPGVKLRPLLRMRMSSFSLFLLSTSEALSQPPFHS